MLSPEVRAARIGKITSSVSAACLGVDDDKTEIDACLEITGEGPDDDEMPEEMRKACERGTTLEGVVLAWGAEQVGADLFDAPFREHVDHDWLADSTDGIYMPHGAGPTDPFDITEGKTVALGGAHHYGREYTDEVKTHALVQSRHHLACWPDARSCYVPVLIGGFSFEFRLYRVMRDAKFEETMINLLGEWHEKYIVGGRMPPASWKDTDAAHLIKRFANRHGDKPLAATPEIAEWARKKALASQKVKAAKEEEGQAKNRLRELLGNFELVDADWGKVTWRRNKSSYPIDHEAMANGFLATLPPDKAEAIIAEHTKEKPGNMVLNVYPGKALKKEMGL